MLIAYIYAHAQITLTGKVVDAKNGTPIEGASIKLKNSKGGTYTGNGGSFTLSARPGDILEVTSIGYIKQIVGVNSNETNITISMEPISAELKEIVFVGSRGAGRAKTETPVPVDIIKINQVELPTAKMDLTSVLNVSAPSFN